MMDIRLDLIQPSPHPIRSSWDEDKMMELTDSIKEQGLIVPIKVRPTLPITPCNIHGWDWLGGWYEYYNPNTGYNEGCRQCAHQVDNNAGLWAETEEGEYAITLPIFEIVYGHRRAEACRRAGLDSIESLVEGVDDTDALIQSLIENVQREDMEPMDIARALKELQGQTGWSQHELGRRGIMDQTRASQLLALLTSPLEIHKLITRAPGGEVPTGKVTEAHMRQAIRAARGDDSVVIDSIRKAASEGLTADQTRHIAEAIAHAEDEAEREAILSTDPADPLFDRMVQAKAHVHRKMEREQQRKRQEDPREVRAFLDSVRAFRAVCQEAVAIAEYGKFSPEAKQFAIRQLDRLIADIESLKSQLEV